MTSLGISVAALVISLLTFIFNAYYQYLKRPNVDFVLGDLVQLSYGPHGEMIMGANVTLLNSGAAYATVVKIVGDISSVESDEAADVEWRCFVESKDIARPGAGFKPSYCFDGWIQTLIIPARGAIVREIAFWSKQPFQLRPGIYRIEFRCLQGPSLRISARTHHTISISASDSAFLDQKCRPNEKGLHEASLSLTLDVARPKGRWHRSVR